jgi:hypothetical protein
MSAITITDPAVLDVLQKGGEVEIKDPSGLVLGTFTVPLRFVPPPGMLPRLSDEEREKRRQHRDGRKLADILRDLEARG